MARAADIRRHEDILDGTGIRALRRRPVVTTPNVFPPARFEPGGIEGEPAPNDEPRERRTRTSNAERRTQNHERRTSAVAQSRLLRLQAAVLAAPPLLRSAVSGVRGRELRGANRARRSARARRAADRRAREDRLSGRPRSCCAPARDLIVTTRFPRNAASRYAAGTGLRRVGRAARDLRPRSAPHAERRGVLPRHRRHA